MRTALETTLFDPAEYLDSPEMIAAYLEAMVEDGNELLIAAALGDVAKAKSIIQAGKDVGAQPAPPEGASS
jgi:probable addiction module antidote protein